MPEVGYRLLPACSRSRPRALAPQHIRIEPLATLKLHYDGWLTLPANLREMLDLKTGDRLEADLIDGAIVLRPASGTRAPTKQQKAAETPVVASALMPSVETVAPVKRPRGRPRKIQAVVEDERQPESGFGTAGDALLSLKRKRGRPRKVRTEEVGQMPEPEPQPLTAEAGHWKLRPKAELQAATPDTVPLPLPPRRREAVWTGEGYEREERRPFRNVEVRKLGPGRRHNRTQQTAGS
jgi:bifunctional DNA-binding transcriptional regulator/antitoxin component of YhaV-PrlF toxin-antitoxin module